MRLRFVIPLLGGALLVMFWWGSSVVEPSQPVETVSVDRGDLERVIRVRGEVINDRSVSMAALVDGQVIDVAVSRGEQVENGQVLASMDNRASAARLQRARAHLKQQTVRRRREQLRHIRIKRLAEKGAVSDEQLEEAKLDWETASAAWQVAEADLRLAEVALDWQQVRAPFAGVVVDKSTESGQWVEAGTKLFTLVALDNWEIEAHVDAVDSGRVRLGQAVEIRCDAFPGRHWQSTVKWIGPSVEQQEERRLNTFSVRLSLGEESPPLLLGQQVDLEILLERRIGVLTLPFAALRERDSGFEVAVIETDRLRYHSIEVGLEGDNRVELLAGLKEGEQVVRLDGKSLQSGSRVKVERAP